MNRILSLLVDLASEEFGCSRETILGKRRGGSQDIARACVVWIARQDTELSFPEIGSELGRRHHTTIMAAEKTHLRHMVKRQSVADATNRVRERLRDRRERWLVRRIAERMPAEAAE